jgi:hypothetical protein
MPIPFAGWIIGGLAAALAIAVGFGAWQLDRVSDRDIEIGQQNVRIEGLNSRLTDERSERLQDRAYAALNARNQSDAMRSLEFAVQKRQTIERKIYVDRPTPVDIEHACRPVLDAFNADLDELWASIRGTGGEPGASRQPRTGADPGLRAPGAAAGRVSPDR